MTLRTVHPARLAAAAGALLALLGIVLVVLAGSPAMTRTELLGSLQRPAVHPTTRLGPHRLSASLAADGYQLGLRISPNRAAAHNTVVIAVTRHGAAVKGARVTVVYSMPAMNMQNALSSTLAERRPASYAVREPVLGMPGAWVMRLEVRPASGTPFTVTVNDLLR